jgi:hypothetical protein
MRDVHMKRRQSRPIRARGPNVWVVRRERRFSVRLEGKREYLLPPITQALAVDIARLIARANRSELIVQRRNGRIRLRDSHGNDPFPPRG